jgi:RimJ/RimL family protein N-acetyltransferase
VLQGQLVYLRARLPVDVPVLHAQLHDDVATHLLASGGPWLPIPPDSEDSPFAVKESREDLVRFSVVEISTGALVGTALLWGVDTHNRRAHLGLTLMPDARGRGLGADVVSLLCRYGFSILGLHRLQIETASDNLAMQKTAHKAGFTQEGIQREAYWTNGRFTDDVLFGLLADEWTPPEPDNR